MTKENFQKTYGFIGLGLIGGSIARCIRNTCPNAAIMAYNYYETEENPRLAHALSDGVLSEITTSLEDFSRCDIIFLCTPVCTNIEYLDKLNPYLKSGCILTDVGSVKGDIHRAVREKQMEHCFIGGHPMAGTEKIGYEYSFADLLRDCYYILTPTRKTPPEALQWMQSFLDEVIHARCVTVDVDEHDRATAGISHGPHVISAALVNAVSARDNQGIYELLAAGGFKDITRISSSSPDMWQNVCLDNRKCILDFLEEFSKVVKEMQDAIERRDGEAIYHFFASAKEYRDQLIKS